MEQLSMISWSIDDSDPKWKDKSVINHIEIN